MIQVLPRNSSIFPWELTWRNRYILKLQWESFQQISRFVSQLQVCLFKWETCSLNFSTPLKVKNWLDECIEMMRDFLFNKIYLCQIAWIAQINVLSKEKEDNVGCLRYESNCIHPTPHCCIQCRWSCNNVVVFRNHDRAFSYASSPRESRKVFWPNNFFSLGIVVKVLCIK